MATDEIHVYDWPVESALLENAAAVDLHTSPETWHPSYALYSYNHECEAYLSLWREVRAGIAFSDDPGPAIAMTYQWRREAR